MSQFLNPLRKKTLDERIAEMKARAKKRRGQEALDKWSPIRAARLRRMREKYDMTQFEMADWLGVSYSYEKQMECGDVHIPHRIMESLERLMKKHYDKEYVLRKKLPPVVLPAEIINDAALQKKVCLMVALGVDEAKICSELALSPEVVQYFAKKVV